MDVEYARPGRLLEPRDGKALVFTRIRFFDDRHEIFPWRAPSVADVMLGSDKTAARHIWLRRLDVTAASWELQPDADGSLAVWLPYGDYALFGTEEDLATPGGPALAVVALLRVPAGAPVVYAGELTFTREWREGWHPEFVFGTARVTAESVDAAVDTMQARYGALPGAPVVSAWCVGREILSREDDPAFIRRSRQMLDAGCPQSR